MDKERALQLAREHVAHAFGESLTVKPAEPPDCGFYGFDPEGWAVFVVIGQHMVGADEYVAVNLDTGESRSLGRYGE